MIKRIFVFTAVCLAASVVSADQIEIPHPPQANTKARAAEMKANLDAIVSELNSQDLKIGALEEGKDVQPVSVDCGANSLALNEALAGRVGYGPPLWFEVTGECQMSSETYVRRQVHISVGTAAARLTSAPGALQMSALAGGHLVLSGVELVDYVGIVYGSGYLGLIDTPFAGESSPFLYANQGGVLRLNNTFLASSLEKLKITLHNSSVATILEVHSTNRFDFSVENNSSVSCSDCDQAESIEVRLKLNSTFCVGTTGDVVASSVTAQHNSSISLPNSDESKLGVVTVDSSSVLDTRGGTNANCGF